MGFHDSAIFPDPISFGTSGGWSWDTAITVVDSGAETRNQRRAAPRHLYRVGLHDLRQDHFSAVKRFLASRKGAVSGFRFRDPFDWISTEKGFVHDFDPTPFVQPPASQLLGSGDGSRTQFQLKKKYENPIGSDSHTRIITRPIAANGVDVAVNAVELIEDTDYTVSYASGVVQLNTAPLVGEAVTADFYFHTPVRLADETDRAMIASLTKNDFVDGEIGLFEILDTDAALETPAAFLEQPTGFFNGFAEHLGSLLGTSLLAFDDGRVQTFKNTSGGTITLGLPDENVTEIRGGPVLYVENDATSTHSIQVSRLAGPALLTIAPDEVAECWLGVDAAGLGVWKVRKQAP